jgi:hypothetical protein
MFAHFAEASAREVGNAPPRCEVCNFISNLSVNVTALLQQRLWWWDHFG